MLAVIFSTVDMTEEHKDKLETLYCKYRRLLFTVIRRIVSTESDIIHTLVNGEYVTLVAESDSGWAKLMYNGRAVYAIKSFLQ
ncbi:MAG: SH3 domain-containing protein [Acutalibacteraceae bacterium]|nr:SH3 domain-containing protein [Acutalibacteraceae bacterium]